jgi:hypothetical protein
MRLSYLTGARRAGSDAVFLIAFDDDSSRYGSRYRGKLSQFSFAPCDFPRDFIGPASAALSIPLLFIS